MDYEEIAVRMKSFNEERGKETEDEIWVLGITLFIHMESVPI